MVNETWSTLLEELLGLILARIDLVDHARFISVCKHWRSVATMENTTINKSFSLVFSCDHGCLIRRLVSSFFSQWQSARFVGSCRGWLAVVLDNTRLFLLNPFSGESPIPLPPSPLEKYQALKKVVLSSPPELSTSTCIIVLLHALGRLDFYTSGDSCWTMFYDLWDMSRQIMDIVFHKNQLYTIDCKGVVKVFNSEFTSNPVDCIALAFDNFVHGEVFLVNLSDTLLLIKVLYKRIIRNHTRNTVMIRSIPCLIKVFEIDPRNSTYTELESLGDNLLFLSPVCSLCLPAQDYLEFTPNHLYGSASLFGEGVYSICLDKERVVLIPRSKRYPVFFALFRDTIGNSV